MKGKTLWKLRFYASREYNRRKFTGNYNRSFYCETPYIFEHFNGEQVVLHKTRASTSSIEDACLIVEAPAMYNVLKTFAEARFFTKDHRLKLAQFKAKKIIERIDSQSRFADYDDEKVAQECEERRRGQ